MQANAGAPSCRKADPRPYDLFPKTRLGSAATFIKPLASATFRAEAWCSKTVADKVPASSPNIPPHTPSADSPASKPEGDDMGTRFCQHTMYGLISAIIEDSRVRSG